MAFDYQETFSRIVSKAGLLSQRYQLLKQSKAEADKKIADLLDQIKEKDKELADMRNELYYLRMATTISPSRENIEATRSIITNLVRDIDRCIADLSD